MSAVKANVSGFLSASYRLIIFTALAAALLSAWGCSSTNRSGAKPELTVAAAASLKPVLPEIAKSFTKQTGNKLKTSFAASGLLARQIENGGPFDIYLSANKKYMDELVAKKLIKSANAYAEGELALIGKAETLDELRGAQTERVAIANPSHAPYGAAAKEALVKSNLWDAVKDKIVFGSNITQTYEYVKTNNADAGIVSLSMLKSTEDKYLLLDQHLYHPIQQWAGVVVSSDNQQSAEKFLEFLSRPESQKILKSFGYKTAPGAKP